MQESVVIISGTGIATSPLALGKPRVTLIIAKDEVVVEMSPTALVTTNVTIEGGGVIIGRAEMLASVVF